MSNVIKVVKASAPVVKIAAKQPVSVHYKGVLPDTKETTVILNADISNFNAVANTLQDIPDLSFTATAGQRYKFRAVIFYSVAATTTGSRWTISGPAFDELLYMSKYSLTTTTDTLNYYLTSYDLPAAANATSATPTPANLAEIEGIIKPSVTGLVKVRFASEVASTAVTAEAKSYLTYTLIP